MHLPYCRPSIRCDHGAVGDETEFVVISSLFGSAFPLQFPRPNSVIELSTDRIGKEKIALDEGKDLPGREGQQIGHQATTALLSCSYHGPT